MSSSLSFETGLRSNKSDIMFTLIKTNCIPKTDCDKFCSHMGKFLIVDGGQYGKLDL